MSDNKKLFTPREAAIEVLKKAKELLEKSDLVKSEKASLKKDMAPPSAPGSINSQIGFPFGKKEGEIEKQIAPNKNPKEKAEGNNPRAGMMPKMEKEQNPDKDADAELGEKVEHDVENHMMANKGAEAKEGHKIMEGQKSSEEHEGDKAFIPARLIGSAKLAKFMEHKHAKRKAVAAEHIEKAEKLHAELSKMNKSEDSAPKNPGYGDHKPTMSHVEYAGKSTGWHSDEKVKHRNKAALAMAHGDQNAADRHGKMSEMHDHYQYGMSHDHNSIPKAGKIRDELDKSEEDRSKMSGKSGMVRLSTESNQNQKGVNQHGHKGSSGGISEAGAYLRDYGSNPNNQKSKYGKEKAAFPKEIHKEILKEQKSMPKPKLPG